MQCKDIPDLPILEHLVQHGGIGCTAWREKDGTPMDRSVLHAMPSETPEKLATAKMGQLIKRGLAEGCTCGCRGDYEITSSGLAFLLQELRNERDEAVRLLKLSTGTLFRWTCELRESDGKVVWPEPGDIEAPPTIKEVGLEVEKFLNVTWEK